MRTLHLTAKQPEETDIKEVRGEWCEVLGKSQIKS